jgi:hypothetical protein
MTQQFTNLAYYEPERLLVEVLHVAAYMSNIRYTVNEIEYDVYVDNTDLSQVEGFGYEYD